MSRKLMLAGVAGLLLMTVVFGAALAQGTTPPAQGDQPQFGQRFPMPWRGMPGGMMGPGGMFGGQGQMPGGMMGGQDAFGMMGGMGLFGVDGDGWKVYDAVAASLKLTPTQLFEQLHSGKSLDQIAAAQGVQLTAVQAAAQTAMLDAMRARIDRAVEAGQLTREQADQMLERMEQGNQGNGGMMPGRGFFRNFRGLPFFRNQAPGLSF